MPKNKARDLFLPPNSQSKEKGAILIPILIIAAIGYFATPAFLSTASKDFGMVIASGLVALSRSIFSIVSDLSSGMISKMLSPEWGIINDRFFSSGWVITRDVANLFIVLALVAIAMATILRFKDYEAKKLLPYLIGIALLVNFSGVFCGVIIDASNILMGGFNNGDYVARQMYDRLVQGEHNTLDPLYTSSEQFLDYTAAAAAYILAYLVLSFAFLMYSILLLVRYVMLGILYILSPMAFVFWIFPKTRNLSTKWLTNFMQWAFFGAMAAFFIHLASQVLSTFTGAGTITVFTVAILVIVGLRMSYKTSAIGAGAIIGLGAAAFTGGAALGWMGLKQFARELGGKKLKDAAKERFTGIREYLPRALGGVTAGTAGEQRKERFAISNEDKKALDNATPDQLRALARGSAYTQRAVAQQRYATEKMFESGKAASLPIVEQERIARQAITNGSDAKELLKKAPYLAHLNEGAVIEEKRKLEGKINPRTGFAYTPSDMTNPRAMQYKDMQQEAEQKVRASGYKKLNTPTIRELPVYAFTSDVLENNSDNKMREVLKDLPEEQEKLDNLRQDILAKGAKAIKDGNLLREKELEKLRDRLDASITP